MDHRETSLGLTERDEATIVNALKRHEPQAFAAVFETHADRVYRLAAGILGNDADAQDVVQATFLSAFEAIDRFEPHAQLGTWLYRIAYNHALMIVRRRHPNMPLPGEEVRDAEDEERTVALPTALLDWSALPEEEMLSAEAQQTLRAAIVELPPGLRAAFVLRDVEGLSTVDCAQVQGLSNTACKASERSPPTNAARCSRACKPHFSSGSLKMLVTMWLVTRDDAASKINETASVLRLFIPGCCLGRYHT